MYNLMRRIRDQLIRGVLIRQNHHDEALKYLQVTVARQEAQFAEIDLHRGDLQRWVDATELFHQHVRLRIDAFDTLRHNVQAQYDASNNRFGELEKRLAAIELSLQSTGSGRQSDPTGQEGSGTPVAAELAMLRTYLLGGNYSLRVAGDLSQFKGLLRQIQSDVAGARQVNDSTERPDAAVQRTHPGSSDAPRARSMAADLSREAA